MIEVDRFQNFVRAIDNRVASGCTAITRHQDAA
jgi:hypothetical protein